MSATGRPYTLGRVKAGPGLTGKGYAPHVTRWHAARIGAWLVDARPITAGQRHWCWSPFTGVAWLCPGSSGDTPPVGRTSTLRYLLRRPVCGKGTSDA